MAKSKQQIKLPTRSELGFKEPVSGFPILEAVFNAMRDNPIVIEDLNKYLESGKIFSMNLEIFNTPENDEGFQINSFVGYLEPEDSLSYKHKILK